MSRSFIVSAARRVDGTGDLTALHALWSHLIGQGARCSALVIDPLSGGWDSPIEPNHFRSGCAPIEALAEADRRIREGKADAVLVHGEEPLRTRYANDKALRNTLMAIYGPTCSIPQAYTALAQVFMKLHGMSGDQFKKLAALLYENYTRTAVARGEYQPPRDASLQPVTELFRGVDCANPVVDFEGAIILTGERLRPAGQHISLLGVATAQSSGDGPDYVDEIARYDHLAQAYREATNKAGVDLAADFNAGRALLEAYTCFPVVPLAFLLASGIVQATEDIPELLAQREITVTGGMNIAKAAWNNPALNALIVMVERLRTESISLGAVHGNGGLGYKHGVAILGRE